MTPSAAYLLDLLLAEVGPNAVIDHIIDNHGVHILTRKTAGIRWELRRTEEEG